MSTINKKRLRGIASNLGTTNYQHYREFLAAIYHQCKLEDTHYSYARFSTDLGLGSSNAHSIIFGHRTIGPKAATNIISALALRGAQRQYFEALVRQERARKPEDREAAFRDRLESKRKSLPTELSRRQLAFFEQWHHAAILELHRLPGASDTPEWITASIRPAISVDHAKTSLALLTDLGYLAYDQTRGRLFPTQATVTTGDEVYGLAISSFHRQLLDLAVTALDRCPPEDRDFGALTLAVPQGELTLIKDELSNLRKRLLKLAQESQNADSIVQINLQMFPLSERKN